MSGAVQAVGDRLLFASIPRALATGLSALPWYENLLGGIFFGLILIPGGGALAGIPAILLFLALPASRTSLVCCQSLSRGARPGE